MTLRNSLIAAFVLASLISCGGGGGTPAPPTSTILSLTLTPSAVSLPPGGSQPFQASVAGTGSYNPAVAWSSSRGGTFSSPTGSATTFTAPLTPGPLTITASSVQDPSRSASATVEVSGAAGPLSFLLPGGVVLDLVAIPAGTFSMGSPETEQDRDAHESPRHQVTLSRAFHMGSKEVTQAQWVAVMGSNPSHFRGDDRPVETVSLGDITGPSSGFLDRLNALTTATRPAGTTFRLPTEAEWEYAARATTTTRFYWGDDPGYGIFAGYGWYGWNSGDVTHPVGQKLPNPWGLFDMAGNVMEWCQDFYGSYGAGPQTDPAGPATGTLRILRGGAAADYPGHCRMARRVDAPPTHAGFDSGFRVVLAAGR